MLAVGVMVSLRATAAANTVFLPASGNWNVPANWSLGVVPMTDQNPILLNGRVATLDAAAPPCGSVFVGQGNQATPRGTVLFRPGASLTAANVLLGRDGTNFGQFNQTGGALTVQGYVSVGDAAGGGSGASGEYNLSAGTLTLPGSAFLRVGNQGVGRFLICGSAVLTTPAIYVGNTAGSSGSKLIQWGGALNTGNLTVGSASTTGVAYSISGGALQWGGLLLVNGDFTVQGAQVLLQRSTNGGVGLQLTDTATLRFDLDARGIAPVQLPGSQISIAAGSKLVLDGTRWARWTGRPGTFTLVRHGGYAVETQFDTNNVTFTGFGSLVPSLRYTTNTIELELTAPADGSLVTGRGLLLEYWELPINDDGINHGQRILPPLSALPAFTNSLVATHPVFGKVVTNVSLAERRRDTNYFLRFTGSLQVPTNGAYTFYLNSDDGSMLWVDGALVVTNDGPHAAREISATTNLTAGLHAIQVGYFQNTGGATLELRWAGPGFAKQLVPDTALFLSAQPELPVWQPAFRNITYDHDMMYNYAPSFLYDETEGLYKIWMCTGGAPGTGPGDYIIYKEATSLEGLLAAPLQIALAPSHDATKFDQVHACDPNVYRVGDVYYLTYSGNTDNTQLPERTRIGMAVSYDRGRTFTRLHGGAHIIEPDPGAYAGGYGDGQSAVVRANDGWFHMIFTHALGGTNADRLSVVRSLDPAFTPGSFTNVASLVPTGYSVDLAYDTNTAEFIVLSGTLDLRYYNANWQPVRTVSFNNPFGWTFGEGHALLTDSRKQPLAFNQEGVASYVFSAATVEDTANTELWAPWVEGDLKCLVTPQTKSPALAAAQVISEGWSFAGNGSGLQYGPTLGVTNDFAVDFWAWPAADASLRVEATNGVTGNSGQRYLVAPQWGAVWGAGHAGAGVSVGRNGIGVFEYANGYLPSLLTWTGELSGWTHVAVVYSNRTPRLFLNGQLARAGRGSAMTFVHPSASGFGGNSFGLYAGRSWNYRVWNRALSPAEIALLPGDTAEANLPAALVGRWLQDPAIGELSSNGTPVLRAVVAGQWPGDTNAFSLADDAGGRFGINATSGLVAVLNGTPLDYEAASNHTVLARAVDNRAVVFERSFDAALTNVNEPPALSPISDTSLLAGRTLTFTNVATDPEAPPQLLTFNLLAPPDGAGVNATNGLFTWRPAIAQNGTTTLVRVRVADDGAPSLSATQSFTVTVLRPVEPVLSSPTLSNGQFSLLISGDSGPDYDVYASTNLTDWALLWPSSSPTLPFLFVDLDATNHLQRFYRVRLGP